MKKIGLLVMAIVLAIGALGVGYAAWTDQILINGTVNTGNVDINAVYFSGTDIYKDVDPLSDNEGMKFTYFWLEDADHNLKYSRWSPFDPGDDTLFWVAGAGSSYAGDDMVDMTFSNLFPQTEVEADVIIHCDGTVPVIVTADIDTDDPMLQWLWDHDFVSVRAAWVYIEDDDGFFYRPCGEINGPIQMHYCDYAKVWLGINLPQHDDERLIGSGYTAEDFMGLENLKFTGSFDAIQWNESPFAGQAPSNPCAVVR